MPEAKDEERLKYEALRQSYRDIFRGPPGEMVMADIARMGRASKTTFVIDDPAGRQSATLEGKRQLWLYIRAMASEGDELLRQYHEKE